MTFAEMIKRLVPIAASSGLEDPPRGLGDYGLKGGGARNGVFLGSAPDANRQHATPHVRDERRHGEQ